MANTSEKTLLVGNGINRVFCDSDYSWGDLLKDLSKLGSFDSGNIDLSNPFKPLPLAFEEILRAKQNYYKESVQVLKRRAAEIFEKLPVRKAHKMIVMSAKYRNVLTTNYEYTLEKAYAEIRYPDKNYEDLCKNKISTNEEIHSLMRRYEFTDECLAVWHIHGEINHTKYLNAEKILPSNSILIGYNQYVSYLDTIYRYFFTEKKTKYTEYTSLQEKMTTCLADPSRLNIETWIDFFFFRDIDIIGLTLDFSEMHLWWILNRRFSLIKDSDIFSEETDKKASFTPTNTITYYYPKLSKNCLEEKCSDALNDVKQKAILNMLDVLGVITKAVKCKSYEDFYTQVLGHNALASINKGWKKWSQSLI
ncbi:MAG: hypothetical protein WC194_07370 [Mesotoga sp.]|jgi:hypothetical protein|uniref:hypothetical protein n=1 Tax=Mesotoga sp. TaxID=2053577 RepID=UPI00243D645B|nr:SIR2 family protein [Candidatus Cloacimonadota bacterium]